MTDQQAVRMTQDTRVESKRLSNNNLHTSGWAFLTHLNIRNYLYISKLDSTILHLSPPEKSLHELTVNHVQ